MVLFSSDKYFLIIFCLDAFLLVFVFSLLVTKYWQCYIFYGLYRIFLWINCFGDWICCCCLLCFGISVVFFFCSAHLLITLGYLTLNSQSRNGHQDTSCNFRNTLTRGSSGCWVLQAHNLFYWWYSCVFVLFRLSESWNNTISECVIWFCHESKSSFFKIVEALRFTQNFCIQYRSVFNEATSNYHCY